MTVFRPSIQRQNAFGVYWQDFAQTFPTEEEAREAVRSMVQFTPKGTGWTYRIVEEQSNGLTVAATISDSGVIEG